MSLNEKRIAVLVIDIQQGFYNYQYGDGVDKVEDYETLVDGTIQATKKVIRWANAKKIPIIWTMESHRPNKSDIGRELEWEGWHSPEGSDEAGIYKEVQDLISPEDCFITAKRRWDAFYQTDLEIVLKGLNVDHLIIIGAYAGACVIATTLGAKMRDYKISLVKDAILGTDNGISAMEQVASYFSQIIVSDDMGDVFTHKVSR
ncbi:MAG: cysteine hydrolase family protein [Promethearchaeota archaeon]